MTNHGEPQRRGPVTRFWRFLWRPNVSVPLAVLLVGGAVGGLILWGGFSWFVAATNTESFCISCHEIRNHSYADLRQTVHFVNRTGNRAICADCHVPHELVPKLIAKTIAVKDLFFHFTGKIDTPEKYEAHKLEMALRVWDKMRSTDSHSCRGCHQNTWTNTSAQFRRAARAHDAALASGAVTCIDCHQGIAHRPPTEFVRKPEDAILADPDGWIEELRAAAAEGG